MYVFYWLCFDGKIYISPLLLYMLLIRLSFSKRLHFPYNLTKVKF